MAFVMDCDLLTSNLFYRDVVALRAKPQKPVLQGQKTKQS